MLPRKSFVVVIVALLVFGTALVFMRVSPSHRRLPSDPKNWEKLHRGMSFADVRMLLGEPNCRTGIRQKTIFGFTFNLDDCWEYYSGPYVNLAERPADGSYVIYFSLDGTLDDVRRPKHK